jgi:hypothetical protein
MWHLFRQKNIPTNNLILLNAQNPESEYDLGPIVKLADGIDVRNLYPTRNDTRGTDKILKETEDYLSALDACIDERRAWCIILQDDSLFVDSFLHEFQRVTNDLASGSVDVLKLHVSDGLEGFQLESSLFLEISILLFVLGVVPVLILRKFGPKSRLLIYGLVASWILMGALIWITVSRQQMSHVIQRIWIPHTHISTCTRGCGFAR